MRSGLRVLSINCVNYSIFFCTGKCDTEAYCALIFGLSEDLTYSYQKEKIN